MIQANYGNFEGDTIYSTILQCAGCFAVRDEDIVLGPTNSNFNKRGSCAQFFPPNIVSITIPCNGSREIITTMTREKNEKVHFFSVKFWRHFKLSLL